MKDTISTLLTKRNFKCEYFALEEEVDDMSDLEDWEDVIEYPCFVVRASKTEICLGRFSNPQAEGKLKIYECDLIFHSKYPNIKQNEQAQSLIGRILGAILEMVKEINMNQNGNKIVIGIKMESIGFYNEELYNVFISSFYYFKIIYLAKNYALEFLHSQEYPNSMDKKF